MLNKLSWKSTVMNLYVIGVLLILVTVFTIVSPVFISWGNVVNILRQAVPSLLIGCAVTLLMISGHVDLSVGGILGLASVLFGLMLKMGLPYILCIILTLIFGLGMGAVNGLLVMKLRIVPVIATLATMTLYVGLGKLLSPKGIGLIKGLPDNTIAFGRSAFLLNLPLSFFVSALVIGLLIMCQKKTILGKYAVAIGGNRTAAELSGINAKQIGWLLYIIVGAFAALGGISRTSLLSLGDPTTGAGMEMDAMIAVVLGGTCYTGGEGSVARTIGGVLILACITSGMVVIGAESYWQPLVKGIVLIIAVSINSLVKEKIEE